MLDKAPEGPGNFRQKNPWKKIYEVIDDEYLKQSDVVFPKYFLLK